jgi:hypothetical protein
MRPKRYIAGAAVLVLTGAGFAAWAAIGPATATNTGATLVTSTIILDPYLKGEIFAPPGNAAPRLTARQAVAAWTGRKHFKIPSGVTIQLGLFTLPIGDASGCNKHDRCPIVAHGIAYTWLRKLVYGFSSRVCPAGSHKPAWRCTSWDFIDANTGKYIAGLAPRA